MIGPPVKQAQKDEFLEWRKLTKTECIEKNLPTTQTAMAYRLNVASGTLRIWAREADAVGGFQEPTVLKAVETIGDGVSQPQPEDFIKDGQYDSKAFWQSRTPQVDRALVRAAAAGNVTAIQLIKKMQGELVEKPEVRSGLTADERHRRNLEADRQLRAGGHRVEEVPKER